MRWGPWPRWRGAAVCPGASWQTGSCKRPRRALTALPPAIRSGHDAKLEAPQPVSDNSSRVLGAVEATFSLPNHVRQTPPSIPPGAGRTRSSASSRAPRATPSPRWRRRPGGPMSATGSCSRAGARRARSRRSRRRRRRSPRSWPPRPTESSGRSRSLVARRRSPPRTAPRTHPNPCDSGAVAAVMAGIRRQHGTDPLRRAAPLELDAARAAARADRHLARSPGRATGRCCCSASPPRSDAPSSSRSTSRTSSSTLPRAEAHDPQAPRPTRNGQERRSPSRTRARETLRRPRAAALARDRRHPPRPGVPTDAPRRHLHRAASHRPVRRADRQAPRRSLPASPPNRCPGTRCAPATRPPPRPPGSRSAR